MRSNELLRASAVCGLLVLFAGCGGTEPAPVVDEAPAPAPVATGPRAFFVLPQDGATVTSPVMIEFGSDDFTIAAVPEGIVTEPRPSLGHYHVAVDAACLPDAAEIPKAAPWVHFGDGKNVIDMQLPAGSHTLTVQIGDDLHHTIPGLCSTISVNVTE